MTTPDIRFTGSIPANYDKLLGGVFFEPYALDAAARLPRNAKRVLEVACGSGVVTRRLRAVMPADAHLTATDLSEGMVAYARSQMPGAAGVDFQPADAGALPFPDASFDAIACQFGIMFVPDKAAAYKEFRRVLAPGGTLLFSVWDSFDKNPVSRLARETVVKLFPNDPPDFLTIPFGYFGVEEIRATVRAAGFTAVTADRVPKEMRSPSARDVAAGFATGTPLATALAERPQLPVERVIDAIAFTIAAQYGERPVVAPMQAIVFTATARSEG
jgi:SAM-dependent methyltransferase